jgi:perosamine synthetase
MYTICVDKNIRDSLLVSLRSQGIQASVHFDPPVHLQAYYLKQGHKKAELPVTEKLSKSIITLPMFPELKREELDYMIDVLREEIKGKISEVV